MIRTILRVLAGLLAFLVGWLGAISPSTATPVEGALAATYTYGDINHAVSLTHTMSERGPPDSVHSESIYDADGQLSLVASARPNVPTTPPTYDYDDTAPVVQSDIVAATTNGPARAHNGGLSSFGRSDVAANTGQKWAYRGVGWDHPGYRDALQAGTGPGHMVVTSPLGEGRFLVRDPRAGGSTYEVGSAWIGQYVSGGVFR